MAYIVCSSRCPFKCHLLVSLFNYPWFHKAQATPKVTHIRAEKQQQQQQNLGKHIMRCIHINIAFLSEKCAPRTAYTISMSLHRGISSFCSLYSFPFVFPQPSFPPPSLLLLYVYLIRCFCCCCFVRSTNFCYLFSPQAQCSKQNGRPRETKQSRRASG